MKKHIYTELIVGAVSRRTTKTEQRTDIDDAIVIGSSSISWKQRIVIDVSVIFMIFI